MILRIRLRKDGWQATGEDVRAEPFAGLPAAHVPGVWKVLSSIAGHVLTIALIVFVSQHMSAWLGDDDIDWSRYQAEPLRLHLSEPLYFRASAREPERAGAAARGEQPAPAPAGSASSAAGARSLSASAVPRRLELPVPPQVSKSPAIIVQPDFQPQLAPPPTLPPLAFWARQSVDLPKPPPPKEVVTPGRTEDRSPAPSLAARPVLAVPNREVDVAEVNISRPPAPQPKPALTQPAPSATTPVRLRDATEARAASFEAAPGQAANVLSLAAERLDQRDVQVPKGLQSIPAVATAAGAAAGAGAAVEGNPGAKPEVTAPKPGPGAGAGSGSTSASASGQHDGAGTQKNSSGSSASPGRTTSASANSGSTGKPASSDAAPANTNANGNPGRTGSSAGTTADPAIAAAHNAPRTPAPPETTRIQHSASGNFDVVVMQSRSRDDLPDTAGILTGTPVYTVYLAVGGPREWLLEYCAQSGAPQQASPYQINVDETGSITPPYPISTTIPNSVLGQLPPKNILLHGFLTANGSLRNVKAMDASNPLAVQILALLGEWQFRPALRNNKPVDVEILLVVPARS